MTSWPLTEPAQEMLPVCPPLENVLVPGVRLAPGETESTQVATQTARLGVAAVTGAGTSATAKANAATAARSRPIVIPPFDLHSELYRPWDGEGEPVGSDAE
jgi:hypothetical protein